MGFGWSTRTSGILLLAGAATLTGCKAKEMGVEFADKQAGRVDNSWLLAANACWPELTHSGYSLKDVKRYLADPLHFRATFAGYSTLGDAALAQVAGQPLLEAPAPDASVLNHSPNPVLTRREALAGGSARGALVSESSGVAPQDTLCAIQAGTPVGFR